MQTNLSEAMKANSKSLIILKDQVFSEIRTNVGILERSAACNTTEHIEETWRTFVIDHRSSRCVVNLMLTDIKMNMLYLIKKIVATDYKQTY